MTEDFLLYVWRLRQFDHTQLRTDNTSESIEILHVGERNEQSGPDFFNARIRIGETIWAGNVEIHVKSSDWSKHSHSQDPAYQNVILHVVYENDLPLQRADGSPLPVLELRQRISPVLFKNYQQLFFAQHWIPCSKLIGEVDSFVVEHCLERILIERLQQKIAPILALLTQNHHSWEETLYQSLGKAFGTKVNAEPFGWLTQKTPLSVLAKHKDQLLQIEALLFGQAGFLEGYFADDYPRLLQREYQFLRNKFQLQPILGHSWKTGGLRPPNFPTIRLAQFAALIHQSSALFSKFIATEKVRDIDAFFDITPSEYWTTHYVFDKAAKASSKKIGKNTIDLFIINTLVPLLFVYGQERDMPDLQDRALEWLQQLAAEDNAIIDEWRKILPLPINNAAQTQALLHLKPRYCDAKRCLSCPIGNKIVQGR